MGKYKQWLQHQERGRSLREQIAQHEQERERVQRMAPSHPTTLPDTSNPLVSALLDYTSRGNTLGINAPLAAAGASAGDSDPHLRQPVVRSQIPQQNTAQNSAANLAGDKGLNTPRPNTQASQVPSDVLSRLNSYAAQVPENPVDALHALANNAAKEPEQNSGHK